MPIQRPFLDCILLAAAPAALAQEAQVGQVVVNLPGEESEWFLEGKVEFVEGEIHLVSTDLKRATITSKFSLPDDEFTVQFDFRISSERTTGQHNGMHAAYRHPLKEKHWHAPSYFWDIDLSNPRLMVRSRVNGRIEVEPLLGDDLAMDTWYRAAVANAAGRHTVRVHDGTSGHLLAAKSFPHDGAPGVPQPVAFWADSELFGLRPKVKPPAVGVFAPYNQYKLANEWSQYIKVGGTLRNVSVSRAERPPIGLAGSSVLLDAGELALVRAAGESLALRAGGAGRNLLYLPGPQGWLAATVGGGSSTAWRVKQLTSDPERLEARQVWESDGGPTRITIAYILQRRKPYMRVRFAAENLQPGKRQIDFTFMPRPVPELAFSAKAYTFPWAGFNWKKYFTEGAFDFDIDLKAQPLQFRWGIAEFSWGDGPGLNVFLPIVALRGSGDESLVVTWDNRASLGFRADRAGWSVTKRFNLDSPAGSADHGFDIQDGDGEIPHELVIGHTRKTDWPELVNDFYLDAYPLYKMDNLDRRIHLAPGLIGSHETFFTVELWTEEKARRQAMEGARYIGLFFAHANLPRYAREFGLNKQGAEMARRYGLLAGMSDNIAVAPQPMEIADPGQNYARFADSWVYNEEGSGPFINWEGVTVNQSPRFSFGQYELGHHQKLIEENGLQFDYMDLYYCWGTDYGHAYKHYGFYPLIVGINEWLREKSAWLRERGVSYTLNAPHRHSSLVRFGEIVQGDIGDVEFFPVFHKIQSGSRLLRAYGAPTEAAYAEDNPRYQGKLGSIRKGVEFALFGGLARQSLPPDDFPAGDRPAALEILNKNIALGFAVGQSRLVDGKVFRSYNYRSDNGDLFTTVRNPEPSPAAVSASFSERQAPDPKMAYRIFEWDVDGGARLVAETVGGPELAGKPFSLNLGPQESRVLMALPRSDAMERFFLVCLPEAGLQTSFSTGLLGTARVRPGGGAFEVEAVAGRETLTRLRLPPERQESARVDVTGVRSFDVIRGQGYLDLMITHGAKPAVVEVTGL